jgi:hypothetical protein
MNRTKAKSAIRRILAPRVAGKREQLESRLLAISQQLDTLDAARRLSQHTLVQQYQLLMKLNLPLPKFADTGFRVYSQSDEDGLLLFVFSLIGMTNRFCVDIAAGVPDGANSANLIRNWGFAGFLFEANEDKVRESIAFYDGPETNIYPPKIKTAMVTAENVNDLLTSAGVEGEIDLFSLDIDGIDYWVWKNLGVISPRVIICEFTSYWGADKAITIPYDPNFTRPHVNYFGASLGAFVKLAKQKGYRLVGLNRYGYNAIFVREGLGEDVLPEVTAAECLGQPMVQRWRAYRFGDFPDPKRYPWVEV